MKLFTKEINNKLFAQYPKGSDLRNQVAVAKIFNPYGKGRWFLINSDPQDPNYIWAIVQIGDVLEVGSVSRQELESIRVSAFKFPLERDLGFSMVNAQELYNGLNNGKFYNKGGSLDSYARGGMVAGRYYKDNSGKEFRFIGESNGKLLFKDEEKVVEKSEDDFEDVPRETKLFGFFEEGGQSQSFDPQSIVGRSIDEGKVISVDDLGNDNFWITTESWSGLIIERGFSKDDLIKLAKGDKVEGLKMYAKGGGIYSSDSLYYLQVLKDGEEVAREKFRAKNLKEATLIAQDDYEDGYKSKFGDHLSFIVSEAMEDGGELINNALNLEVKKMAIAKGFTPKELGRDYELNMAQATISALSDANFHSEAKKLVSILEKQEWSDSLYNSDYYNASEQIDEFGRKVAAKAEYDGVDIANAFEYVLKMNGFTPLANKIHKAMEEEMAKGGYMAKGGMMEHGLRIGDKITDDMFWDNKIVVENQKTRKRAEIDLETGKRKDEMAKGGYMAKGRKLVGKQKNLDVNKNGKLDAEDFKMLRGEKMAMGGETSFDDKVKSVEKSLLKRKKVAPIVQKDYGKTYDKKEAHNSALRIVGAQTAKWRQRNKK